MEIENYHNMNNGKAGAAKSAERERGPWSLVDYGAKALESEEKFSPPSGSFPPSLSSFEFEEMNAGSTNAIQIQRKMPQPSVAASQTLPRPPSSVMRIFDQYGILPDPSTMHVSTLHSIMSGKK